MAHQPFTLRVIQCVRDIPEGMVTTYGRVAAMCGNPRAARQVALILHSCSRNEGLPWHRVIGAGGRISLKPLRGYERQRELLESEGVEFDHAGKLDMDRFLWKKSPGRNEWSL